MFIRKKHRRIVWITITLIFLSVALFFALIFVNDRPGGLSDRRMSRELGLKETIHIPLGKTPDDAIQQFRGYQTRQIIHRVPVEGGILLFMKQFNDGSNLQVEYVRKTWLGWKWVWGGGFGISETKSALSYMIIPKLSNVTPPFPMVFGEVIDPLIKNVSVETKDKSKHNAKLIELELEKMIWFVFLPPSTSTPFEIEGYSQEGNLIAYKAINDPNDSGSVEIRD